MDALLAEIEEFAAEVGLSPSTIVQKALPTASGAAFARWKRGGGCTVRSMERIRAYIAAERAARPLRKRAA